ncbi:MAG: GreA/GreB family elongation factor [Novosphingobium sp.]
MSVAFRRDGDEEHLEPKFEIPIPPGPNLVTARGMSLIDANVDALAAQLAALADCSADDAAVKAFRRDLRYWQTRQITAEVMPVPSGDAVAFGSRVTFRLNGAERILQIVGDDEADPASGSISFSAPLARAMMGAEAGDLVEFAGKDDAIEILSVGADA